MCWRLLSGFSVHLGSAEAQALTHTLDPQNGLPSWQCNPQKCAHMWSCCMQQCTHDQCVHTITYRLCACGSYVLMCFCLVGKVLHAFSHILWTAFLLCKYITTIDKKLFLISITLKSTLFFPIFKFCSYLMKFLESIVSKFPGQNLWKKKSGYTVKMFSSNMRLIYIPQNGVTKLGLSFLTSTVPFQDRTWIRPCFTYYTGLSVCQKLS